MVSIIPPYSSFITILDWYNYSFSNLVYPCFSLNQSSKELWSTLLNHLSVFLTVKMNLIIDHFSKTDKLLTHLCKYTADLIFRIFFSDTNETKYIFFTCFFIYFSEWYLTCFQFSFLSFSLFSFFNLHQVRQVLNTPSEYLFIYTNAKTI